jgi:hypothetical protein
MQKKINRENIITSMCYTMRHDYGLTKQPNHFLSAGMTEEDRKHLWNQMAQIFDNDIAPVMEFKKDL